MLVSRFLEQQIPQSRRLAFAIDYNDDVIKVHARKLYDLLLPHLWLTAAPPNPVPFSLSYEITEGVYSLAVKLLRKYMTIASTHKHRAYQGECEVRLLESTGKEGPGDRLKHRLRGYDLLPYTDFIWAVEEDTSPLVSITAGPATDWLKASNFLHTCTTRFAKRFHHEGQIRFAQSTNPYAVV
jgi:hypothetical protein